MLSDPFKKENLDSAISQIASMVALARGKVRLGSGPTTIDTPIALPRPLFRPMADWQPTPPPSLNVTDYDRRKAMRELEMAFTNRSVALHRHRFS